jgi:DNA adenine methylase
VENDDHAPVRPIRTLAGYVGGKRALAGALCERIAAIPHEVYAEPFLGMGGVFFRRAARPKVEAVNDVTIAPFSTCSRGRLRRARNSTGSRASTPAR